MGVRRARVVSARSVRVSPVMAVSVVRVRRMVRRRVGMVGSFLDEGLLGLGVSGELVGSAA